MQTVQCQCTQCGPALCTPCTLWQPGKPPPANSNPCICVKRGCTHIEVGGGGGTLEPKAVQSSVEPWACEAKHMRTSPWYQQSASVWYCIGSIHLDMPDTVGRGWLDRKVIATGHLGRVCIDVDRGKALPAPENKRGGGLKGLEGPKPFFCVTCAPFEERFDVPHAFVCMCLWPHLSLVELGMAGLGLGDLVLLFQLFVCESPL